MTRSRILYLSLLAPVIWIGLASRSPAAAQWPVFLATYTGDTLWAFMLYLLVGGAFPKWSTLRVASIVLGYAYAIEFGQLIQAPWLEEIRHTWVGSMAMGHGFVWSDFPCYTIGVLMGVGLDALGRTLSLRHHDRK